MKAPLGRYYVKPTSSSVTQKQCVPVHQERSEKQGRRRVSEVIKHSKCHHTLQTCLRPTLPVSNTI